MKQVYRRLNKVLFNHEQNVCREQIVWRVNHHLTRLGRHHRRLIDREQNLLKQL